MPVPVEIQVTDKENPAGPIEAVTVNVYDENDVFQSSVATDAQGTASFLLPGVADPGTTYRVRFFKVGVSFAGVKTIAVIEPEPEGTPNDFKETAEPHVNPVAEDAAYCRCSGFYVAPDGQIAANQVIGLVRLAEQSGEPPWVGDPTGAAGRTLLNQDVELKTDAKGYVSVDLPRKAKMVAQIMGMSSWHLQFKVPDAASVDLLDLLFPAPASLVYDPDPATVDVDGTKKVKVTLTLSNGIVADDLAGLEFTSDDTAKVTVVRLKNEIELRGVAAGQVTITASIKEGESAPRVPAPSLSGATLTATAQ